MVRSIDELERVEGTPDSVVFYVNFSPRFVTSNDLFQQSPLPDMEFTAVELESEGLNCRFLVEDPDAHYSERVRYGVRLQTPREREFLTHHKMTMRNRTAYDVTVRKDTTWVAGDYTLYVLAEDNMQSGGSTRGSRSRERSVSFRVFGR